MKFNPHKHHRRSIRLKGYDYSRAGLYFVTICCHNRACLFGTVENDIMELNDPGHMVEEWYRELENKYPDKKCHEMVVMPNHFHCIIENRSIEKLGTHEMDAHVGAPLRGRPVADMHSKSPYGCNNKKYGSSLGMAIGWFKTMTTNEYIRGVKTQQWTPFDGKLWQRNYYEHIIRDEQSYRTISEYIINNPIYWGKDKFYQ